MALFVVEQSEWTKFRHLLGIYRFIIAWNRNIADTVADSSISLWKVVESS
jgi:hypothetical protein